MHSKMCIRDRCYDKAKQILSENMPKLHELAEYLLERETITGEEFMNIKRDSNVTLVLIGFLRVAPGFAFLFSYHLRRLYTVLF